MVAEARTVRQTLPAAVTLTSLSCILLPALLRMQFGQAYSCAVSGTNVYGGQPTAATPPALSTAALPACNAALLLFAAAGTALQLLSFGLVAAVGEGDSPFRIQLLSTADGAFQSKFNLTGAGASALLFAADGTLFASL